MNKTKIEWCDYTWNPITGCTRGCEYCYARAISRRFKRSFRPTFHPKRISEPSMVKKPSRIFTCSMGEFWDSEVSDWWRDAVFHTMRENPKHTFQILTKVPENINLLGEPFPRNVWLGVSITSPEDVWRIHRLKELRVFSYLTLFVSVEPYLERMNEQFI